MNAASHTPAMVLARPSPSAMAVNFIAFQIGWFACVLGAAHGIAWMGAHRYDGVHPGGRRGA